MATGGGIILDAGGQQAPDTDDGFEVHYLLVTLAHDGSCMMRVLQHVKHYGGWRAQTQTADPSDVSVGNHSDGPHFIRVDLVEKDEGDPKYSKIVSGSLEAAELTVIQVWSLSRRLLTGASFQPSKPVRLTFGLC